MEAKEATHFACKHTPNVMVVIYRIYSGMSTVKTLEVAQRRRKVTRIKDWQLLIVSKNALSN